MMQTLVIAKLNWLQQVLQRPFFDKISHWPQFLIHWSSPHYRIWALQCLYRSFWRIWMWMLKKIVFIYRVRYLKRKEELPWWNRRCWFTLKYYCFWKLSSLNKTLWYIFIRCISEICILNLDLRLWLYQSILWWLYTILHKW